MNQLVFFEKELEALQGKDLYRSLRSLEVASDNPTHMRWKNEEYVLFCSNDYLGLSRDESVVAKLQEVAAEYGVGSGASRLISGTTEWHTRLEERIARFKKKDRALVFSSGFLANLGIITAVTDKDSLIVLDKRDHASIIDAARLSEAQLRVYPHKNMRKLESLLQKRDEYNRVLIVTDSVFSMDGDCAPLAEIVALKKKYGALLMIDEAHATGVFGERGGGLAEAYACEDAVDFLMGTLSKGMGVLGGYCAMNATFAEYIINKSRPFIYTTSLPACLCAAAWQSFNVLEDDDSRRTRLWGYVDTVREALQSYGYEIGESSSPIIPMIVGSEARAMDLSGHLLREKIYVPAVRFPTVPKGKARLRITLSSAHAEEDVNRLLAVIAAWKDT